MSASTDHIFYIRLKLYGAAHQPNHSFQALVSTDFGFFSFKSKIAGPPGVGSHFFAFSSDESPLAWRWHNVAQNGVVCFRVKPSCGPDAGFPSMPADLHVAATTASRLDTRSVRTPTSSSPQYLQRTATSASCLVFFDGQDQPRTCSTWLNGIHILYLPQRIRRPVSWRAFINSPTESSIFDDVLSFFAS
ncbi:hypothetical protein BV25DRAFT_1111801 [Artomyces pyxidatus]|uniref:Uncharacterized protein n=1 Tax=Artomyces pyxidatus TaxID=48021 RepID=A0ACB8TGG1_9AGAM|nr:hypothetical protein BV25DRAFT_1111801 [Artomyces pyxidatus]